MTREEFKELKAGDRIIALENTFFKAKDVYGTVVEVLNTEEIVVDWDDDVNGWEDKAYNIKDGHGEYVYNISCTKIEKASNNNIHKLVITCRDGKHTTAEYSINGKIISESKTSRNEKLDDFDFEQAVKICTGRIDFTDVTATKGEGLIGREIKKGQRVRIISVEPHRRLDENRIYKCVCLNEYIGKEGTINYNAILKENKYGASVTFDKEYMNAIDKENGKLCWRWDELELID